MIARRPLLALALLSALTGCAGRPPSGPLAEYRPGLQPTTVPVTCAANYVLVAKDAATPPAPPGEHHLRRGDRVGFRLGPDGSLTAVAPGYMLALPPGSYAWEAAPASIPSPRERQLCEAREHFLRAAKVAGVVTVTALAAIGLFVVVIAVAAATSDHRGYL